VDPWSGKHDLVRGLPGRARRLGGRRGQHHQAGAGLDGQPGYLGDRQVGRQVMDQPAIFAQAGRRHQGGQRVAFSRRRGRHGDASRAAVWLLGTGGDEPFADGAGAVFHRDRQLAFGPFVADPGQRGRDDQLG
jgi:hypothetical protein